jgi:tetratricopeptide (TPR) repeat protein
MRMLKTALVVSAMAMGAAAVPVQAAQPAGTEERTERARALKAEAEALFNQPTEWRRAARLLERSAALRDATDAEAYNCYVLAGRIRSALGEHGNARALLEKAAEHALNRGAVADAAHAFVDAAHHAVSVRDYAVAAAHVERARTLAASPLLSPEDRQSIARRAAE